MSDHAHHHGGAFGRVAVFWTLLGLTELITGSITRTGAIISDGIHYLSDTVLIVVSSLLVTVMEKRFWQRHFIRDQLRSWAAMVVYAATILIIGLVGLLETYSHPGSGGWQMALGGAGLVGNCFIIVWLKRSSRQVSAAESVTYRANTNHVQWDVASSGAVLVAGILEQIHHLRWWSFMAAALILVFMLIHNLPEMWELRLRFHRKTHCRMPALH